MKEENNELNVVYRDIELSEKQVESTVDIIQRHIKRLKGYISSSRKHDIGRVTSKMKQEELANEIKYLEHIIDKLHEPWI